ncbi:prenyltransferase [Nocardiopsis coralliicola]
MTTVTTDTLRAAEHFITRTARLLDRHRYDYLFAAGPAEPVRSALDAYRNLDGGYGNGLYPDLRGHRSEPLAVEYALRNLLETGPIPADTAHRISTYLTSASSRDGGVPPVTPGIRHTEAAPPWRDYAHTRRGALRPTAAIAGLLHRGHAASAWRDRATAFSWTRIAALHWTDPDEAMAICTFLHHVPDQHRAAAEADRLAPMIRAVTELDADRPGDVRRPVDLAPSPSSAARRMFTDAEIDANLDLLERTQQSDGGWPTARPYWTERARTDWRGMATIRRLLVLRAYGRLPGPAVPRVAEG